MEIKTTIIIPNYNGLSFMEPCFESLKEQTVRDFKVLVVDNGSTDGSVEWLKERNIPIFSPLSKVVLIFDMLAGRLELFPLMILFMPSTWRKK